eukprot:3051679-Alexandrium_andersonii.AAC.1
MDLCPLGSTTRRAGSGAHGRRQVRTRTSGESANGAGSPSMSSSSLPATLSAPQSLPKPLTFPAGPDAWKGTAGTGAGAKALPTGPSRSNEPW